MSSITEVLLEVDSLRKEVRGIASKQIFSQSVRDRMHRIASKYFDRVGDVLPDSSAVEVANRLFSDLHELSRKTPSTQKVLANLNEARRALVKLEGASLTSRARQTSTIGPTDGGVLDALREVHPPAGDAYEQALRDLETERLSWRGPAAELREALRETLDKLAPDKEVEAAPGFKLEPDVKRPTMKQKAKYVLRRRGVASGQIDTATNAIELIENMVSGITRAVYTRGSIAIHTPTDRDEVQKLLAWVRVVLTELLGIPHR